MDAPRKLFRNRYLNIQAKLVFPLAATILLLVLVLSPLTNYILKGRIEEEADTRLIEIADSVGALIANSEALARNNAALLSTQPDVIGALHDLDSFKDLLVKQKETLALQELSLYSENFKTGDPAYYYGGPLVTRRLQVNEEAERIREQLIQSAINAGEPVSAVTIAPQNSQVLGAAPVFDPVSGEINGVVLAAFYLDETFIQNISQIIDTDVAIVRDNDIIVSTIDSAAGLEALIKQGWLTSSSIPVTNVTYSNGSDYRLLAHTLAVMGNEQGTVLVAQPIDRLFNISAGISVVFVTLTGVFGATALWFWIAAFLTFTRPLAQLTHATTKISQGDLNQRVGVSFTFFRDEITSLSENFNTMTANLSDSYASLEERVKQRTLELAEARDEAVAANKSKSEFVSVVSHELKIPMTSIKGYSELMLSGATGAVNDNQKNFLQTIRTNVDRMATLVVDLTDISRLESGNLRLEPRSVRVQEIIDEVAGLLRTQVDAKSQQLNIESDSALPNVWCDRNRFAQALTNLISNANKYSPEQARILVKTSVHPDEKYMLQIMIQDNGYGMTPEDQQKLFSKFFRSGDEMVREAPGTGLGMSITKNLIELQGGKIWFESEYRKGTTFYFTVPVHHE